MLKKGVDYKRAHTQRDIKVSDFFSRLISFYLSSPLFSPPFFNSYISHFFSFHIHIYHYYFFQYFLIKRVLYSFLYQLFFFSLKVILSFLNKINTKNHRLFKVTPPFSFFLILSYPYFIIILLSFFNTHFFSPFLFVLFIKNIQYLIFLK